MINVGAIMRSSTVVKRTQLAVTLFMVAADPRSTGKP
jgi:hypothetical protein